MPQDYNRLELEVQFTRANEIAAAGKQDSY
jgi:hypothetical protein